MSGAPGAGAFSRPEQWWQDRAGRAWIELSAETDRQLDPLGRLALDRLAPKGGERVLDVGCGSGQTVVQIAEAVGPTGRVLGVDVSEIMLGGARQRVANAGAGQVELICADAASHAFPAAAFDAIFSRFGVMFFEHPRAAFANLFATLATSGRISFVCWQAIERNPWALLPLRAVQAALPAAPVPPQLGDGPGPFSFAEPAHVGEILASAGFRDIDVRPWTGPLHVAGARTVDEAAGYLMRIGPAARLIGESEIAPGPDVREALAHAVAPFAGADGIWMDAAVWLVTARA